jgi:dihydropteroate synthase
MGIVNVTPDSFSDGGQFWSSDRAFDPARAIAHAQQLIAEGADILDIGGESTRPGAAPVSVEEECARVLPVIDGLRQAGRPISVDTRRPEVMRRAVTVGVDMLNDVNGFRDRDAFQVAVQSTCGLCVMHMQGEPQTMQQAPAYNDVVAEVTGFLIAQRDALMARGVDRQRILLDPGFGFGKTLEHNLALMRALGPLSARQPVLVGVSRKRMIGSLMEGLAAVPTSEPAQRVSGSVAAALWAAAQGAQVLRVHDVGATVQALSVWSGLSTPDV